MAVTPSPPTPPATPPASPQADIGMIWRLHVDQYHAMIQAGILTTDDPVELLEGWLVTKMPKNPRHRVVTQLTREALAQLLPPAWYADAQEPITTADSEPEPDGVVVRGERRHYLDRHPGPSDLALVIEVADSSPQRDRILKKRLYAAAAIAEYWIINLIDNQIEVHTEPSASGAQPDYQQSRIYTLADTLPVVLEGREVGRLAVQDVLP